MGKNAELFSEKKIVEFRVHYGELDRTIVMTAVNRAFILLSGIRLIFWYGLAFE